mmetsp:Transcript_3376/g.8001  ORF Transcript_3376/g.8001 Transcript_3376/m.8001 type:complete len:216 (+) Transcript_3376:148-795(+)
MPAGSHPQSWPPRRRWSATRTRGCTPGNRMSRLLQTGQAPLLVWGSLFEQGGQHEHTLSLLHPCLTGLLVRRGVALVLGGVPSKELGERNTTATQIEFCKCLVNCNLSWLLPVQFRQGAGKSLHGQEAGFTAVLLVRLENLLDRAERKIRSRLPDLTCDLIDSCMLFLLVEAVVTPVSPQLLHPGFAKLEHLRHFPPLFFFTVTQKPCSAYLRRI